MHHVLWCEGTVNICANTACHRYHQEIARRRWGIPVKNQHASQPYHQPSGVLLKKYIFHLPGQAIWATRRSCYGLSNQPHSRKPVLEDFEKKAIDSSQHPLFLEKICRWHLHNHLCSSQKTLPGPFELYRWPHTVHQWRHKTRWFHALSWYFDHPKSRWKSEHHCI